MIFIDKDGYVYSFQSNESDRQVRVAYEDAMIVGGLITGVMLVMLLVLSSDE